MTPFYVWFNITHFGTILPTAGLKALSRSKNHEYWTPPSKTKSSPVSSPDGIFQYKKPSSLYRFHCDRLPWAWDESSRLSSGRVKSSRGSFWVRIMSAGLIVGHVGGIHIVRWICQSGQQKKNSEWTEAQEPQSKLWRCKRIFWNY